MIITNRTEFKKNIVDINVSVQDCVRLLHSLDMDIVFVTKRKKLYGSITDNDLREYYLKTKNIKKFDSDISDLANKKIFFLYKSKLKNYNKTLLKKKLEKFKFIPLVNNKKVITDILVSNNKFSHLDKSTSINAVIMAGGYGVRLKPITNNIPKPVIVINEHSNLISLMKNLKDSKINKFFITTHYLSKLIKKEIDMFWHAKNETNFYYEKKLLGTFGSVIALIKKYTKSK